MANLEDRILKIENRNKNVSNDKSWETSLTRRISIAILTYIAVVIFLVVIENDKPLINSFVPVGGYVFSTLGLKWIRVIWEGHLRK